MTYSFSYSAGDWNNVIKVPHIIITRTSFKERNLQLGLLSWMAVLKALSTSLPSLLLWDLGQATKNQVNDEASGKESNYKIKLKITNSISLELNYKRLWPLGKHSLNFRLKVQQTHKEMQIHIEGEILMETSSDRTELRLVPTGSNHCLKLN